MKGSTSNQYVYNMNWSQDMVLVDTTHRENGKLAFTRKDLEAMIKMLDKSSKKG